MIVCVLLAGSGDATWISNEPFHKTSAARDADQDGVPDGVDFCPGTPLGFPVADSGCALDTDADGVPDGADRCPATRSDSGGTIVDGHGCSVRDQKKERPYRYPTAVG
ncbi:MAG TPA: thrombospondin type 3 repeat-containing protein [Candidatus Polarisedimenticolia bacterium]|nr:thrombospondin type 3 repeat-containing protein [Candidatus Polarisedimenticolia bacterium]